MWVWSVSAALDHAGGLRMVSHRPCLLFAFLAGLSLSIMPAIAQEAAGESDAPTIAAPATSPAMLDGLSGAELVSFLENADEAERRAILASLSPDAHEALIEALAQANAGAPLLATVIADIVAVDPDARSTALVNIMRESSSQELLANMADILVTTIEQTHADLSNEVMAGLLLAALSADTAVSDRVVSFANTLDGASQERFAQVQLQVVDRSPARVASAIETSLALVGGAVAQRATEIRQQALAPITTAIALPSTEAGATSRTSLATSSGTDAIFVASPREVSRRATAASPDEGLRSDATPLRPGRDVSPQ